MHAQYIADQLNPREKTNQSSSSPTIHASATSSAVQER